MSDVVSCLLSNYLLHSCLSPSHICLLRLWTHLTLLFFLVLFLNRQPSHWFGKIPFAPQCKPYGPMIACRLRTFAKCQRPKSGDNTEEGWRGMEREPFYIRIHPHAYRMPNTISRCASLLQTLHHRIIWPSLLSEALYMTCSLCIGPSNLAVFVCLLFSWFRRFCLYFTKLTPLIWLTSTSLSANNQWLAAVWSLAIGFFDAQTHSCWQKAKNTIKDCVNMYAYQQRDLFAVLIEQNLDLNDSVCPLYLFDRKKIIFPVCNSHHQSFNLWSLRLFIYYRSYICSDMKKLLILASVLPCVHTCAV